MVENYTYQLKTNSKVIAEGSCTEPVEEQLTLNTMAGRLMRLISAAQGKTDLLNGSLFNNGQCCCPDPDSEKEQMIYGLEGKLRKAVSDMESLCKQLECMGAKI